MRVAIIGAGVAGLACAHELEKYGVVADVYEKNSFIGEEISHVSCMLGIIHRPVRDPLEYLNSRFGFGLEPLNTVNTIVQYSANKKTIINGKLGYFLERGKTKGDLKLQLYSKLKFPNVFFNKVGDYEELLKQYDYVVDSSGLHNVPKELGCWQDRLQACERGSVVLGDFDPNTLYFWLNEEICKSGYGIMTPFNEKKAFLSLVVPWVTLKEIDNYWDLFLQMVNVRYTIVEEFRLERLSGYVYPHRLGNLFFAGNSGGGLDPLLGFGTFFSMFMGVCAARSMVKGWDYERQIRDVIKTTENMYILRQAIEKFTDKDYDRLVSIIGIPGVKRIMYSTPMNTIKYSAYVAKERLKRNK